MPERSQQKGRMRRTGNTFGLRRGGGGVRDKEFLRSLRRGAKRAGLRPEGEPKASSEV